MALDDSDLADASAEWSRAERHFRRIVAEVGASELRESSSIGLKELAERERPVDEFREQVMGRYDGEIVAIGRNEDDTIRLMRYPYARTADVPWGAFLWLEPHSRLSAWLLMTCWRIHELSRDAREFHERGNQLSAACMARANLETAAVMRYDLQRFAAIWDECRVTPPIEGYPVPPTINDLRQFVRNALFGGKWKTSSPFGAGLERVNILTAIKHLAGEVPGVQRVYDWLCNAVHPSVGSNMIYLAGVDAADWATVVHHSCDELRPGPVKAATTQAMAISLSDAAATLDRGVAILDDIAHHPLHRAPGRGVLATSGPSRFGTTVSLSVRAALSRLSALVGWVSHPEFGKQSPTPGVRGHP